MALGPADRVSAGGSRALSPRVGHWSSIRPDGDTTAATESRAKQKIADAEATLKRYEEERIAKAQAEIATQNKAKRR